MGVGFMKNKVKRRILRAEQRQPVPEFVTRTIANRDRSVEEYYASKLNAYADAVDNKSFGFISNLKLKGNRKIQSINEEYACALDFVNILNELGSSKYQKYLKNEISSSTKRVLDACIRKGFNYPATLLLQTFCKNRYRYFDSPWITIKNDSIKSDLQIYSYLKKIMANYAKKNAYKDNARYLKSVGHNSNVTIQRIKEIETDKIYLQNYLAMGCFGKDFLKKYTNPESNTQPTDELEIHFKNVLDSTKGNPHTTMLQDAPERNY